MRPLPILGIVLLFIMNMQTVAFGTIVIHNVHFERTTPEDAIVFLIANWKNTEPHVKGMDLAPRGFAGKTVTITATDMKFSELVGRVAEKLDAVVIIQSDSILLKPNNGE
ncbi:hypothetical protein JIN85_18920 [Luteolibacter pohnpeiensis]|uniref:Uncharacterized protein n=1 Tax=Luteolibacter pohnpeiensis TaxID=454153 RepID=A0A934VSN2_9BACT|nr:hypothetical protein [Luteolibacter pohnpeiensis]MBK1884496.1 hypothetical protein [Luteolibacter pohnpeiensis]